MSNSDHASDHLPIDAQAAIVESWPLDGPIEDHWQRLLTNPLFTEHAGDDQDDGDVIDPLAALDQLRQAVLEYRVHRPPSSSDCAALWTWLIDAVPRSVDKASAATHNDDLLTAWTNRACFALDRARHVCFGRPRRAEAASVLNDFAKGIAAQAFQPGGVAIAGRIFCAKHSPHGIPASNFITRCHHCASPSDERHD